MHKWISAFGEVENEDTTDADGAQEGADLRYVLARTPLGDLIDILGVGQAPLRRTAVPNCYDLLCAQDGLRAAESTAAVLNPLHNTIETLEVFPDKAAYVWVVWNALLGAVRKYVPPLGPSDRDVVDIGNGGVRDLRL
jgi:hypothetical protein